MVFEQNCDRMTEKAMAGDETTPRVRKGKANEYITPGSLIHTSLQFPTLFIQTKLHTLYNGPRDLDHPL